jgi:hypothetical protein
MVSDGLPESLSLDVAYRAAFHLTDQWISSEQEPCEGLVLFHQYLKSDPARWKDWRRSVQKALTDTAEDPLSENIGPLD